MTLVALLSLPASALPAASAGGPPDRITVHDSQGDATATPSEPEALKPSDDLRVLALTRTATHWNMAFRAQGFDRYVGKRTTIEYVVDLTDPTDRYRYIHMAYDVASRQEQTGWWRVPHHPGLWESTALIFCTDSGCSPVECKRFWVAPDAKTRQWDAHLAFLCLRKLTFDPQVTGYRDRRVNRDDGSTAHREDDIAYRPSST